MTGRCLLVFFLFLTGCTITSQTPQNQDVEQSNSTLPAVVVCLLNLNCSGEFQDRSATGETIEDSSSSEAGQEAGDQDADGSLEVDGLPL